MIPIDSLNEFDRVALRVILEKDPGDLTPDEIEILNARSPYLNSEQKRIFAGVLGEPFRPEDVASDPISPELTPVEEIEQPTAEAVEVAPVNPEVVEQPNVVVEPEAPVNEIVSELSAEQPSVESQVESEAVPVTPVEPTVDPYDPDAPQN